jgi:hypothetical protein
VKPHKKPIAGRTSSPSAPANPQWPTNSGLMLFLPEKTLAAKTTYSATLVLKGRSPIEWSFTTE